MVDTRPLAVCLYGPTASGKTDLAIELVERGPFSIISVDSALIYRDMNIGTAKPDAGTLARAPHALVDIRDPAERYSAGEFRRDALAVMGRICRAGRVPLLVGGTMLYFRTLTHGLAELPQADADLRARLDAEMAALGVPAVHARLAAVDPVAAARIHPHDAQRIQRALEVFELSGRPLTDWLTQQERTESPYRLLCFALLPPERSELHQRIERRLDAMLAAGFVDEVATLRARGDLTLDLPSMRAVGYRQVWEYLDGLTDREQMRQRVLAATRQYAKRQMTWLRGESAATSLPSGASGLAGKIIGVWELARNLRGDLRSLC